MEQRIGVESGVLVVVIGAGMSNFEVDRFACAFVLPCAAGLGVVMVGRLESRGLGPRNS